MDDTMRVPSEEANRAHSSGTAQAQHRDPHQIRVWRGPPPVALQKVRDGSAR